MGWTAMHREPNVTDIDFMRTYYGDACAPGGTREIVAHNSDKEAIYLAIRDNTTGEVYPSIQLKEWRQKEHHNFAIKGLSETCGSGLHNASPAVLKALTATDNPDAILWRAEVGLRHQQAKMVKEMAKPGSTVTFPEPIHFGDGKAAQSFMILGSHTNEQLRRQDGEIVRIKGWKKHQGIVITPEPLKISW
jgi:hypothetical protein